MADASSFTVAGETTGTERVGSSVLGLSTLRGIEPRTCGESPQNREFSKTADGPLSTPKVRSRTMPPRRTPHPRGEGRVAVECGENHRFHSTSLSSREAPILTSRPPVAGLCSGCAASNATLGHRFPRNRNKFGARPMPPHPGKRVTSSVVDGTGPRGSGLRLSACLRYLESNRENAENRHRIENCRKAKM